MTLLNDDKVKLEVIRLHNDGVSLRAISDIIGVPKSTASSFLKKMTYSGWWAANEKPIAGGELHDHHHIIKKFAAKTYIITSAQNSTFVHRKFVQALEQMAAHRNAKIMVGTYSYNLSGFQNLEKGDGTWFDPKIAEYIVDEPVQLADGLIYCGELNILPTAVNPLSGFHSYTKKSSGIIPHAKVQLESLPVSKGTTPKMLYTTGTVTQRNYIQKKSGQKASFHHVFGALVVEIDAEGDWFVRQLIADTETGEFYDLDTLYTADGYTTGNRIEGINYGDIHAEKADPIVYGISFGDKPSSILDTLRPKYQFVHDVHDFTARNHHTINDPYFRFNVHVNGQEYVEDGVYAVGTVLSQMQRDFVQTVVVESNHDLALVRWLKTADYKTDPANALFFLDCQLQMYKSIARKDNDFNVFEYAVKSRLPHLKEVQFLKTDQSFMICGADGIECGQHGDLGNNGSKGGINAYQRLATRYNIGHSHSTGIKDGVYQAGVSGKLDMTYNTGGSSWSHSHIITYVNSKRAIITIKKGKWKA